MPSRPPDTQVYRSVELCPKVGVLGDRCLEPRFHGGKHTFPPNPQKQPGVKPKER